jgi:hypothetical protein
MTSIRAKLLILQRLENIHPGSGCFKSGKPVKPRNKVSNIYTDALFQGVLCKNNLQDRRKEFPEKQAGFVKNYRCYS